MLGCSLQVVTIGYSLIIELANVPGLPTRMQLIARTYVHMYSSPHLGGIFMQLKVIYSLLGNFHQGAKLQLNCYIFCTWVAGMRTGPQI